MESLVRTEKTLKKGSLARSFIYRKAISLSAVFPPVLEGFFRLCISRTEPRKSEIKRKGFHENILLNSCRCLAISLCIYICIVCEKNYKLLNYSKDL